MRKLIIIGGVILVLVLVGIDVGNRLENRASDKDRNTVTITGVIQSFAHLKDGYGNIIETAINVDGTIYWVYGDYGITTADTIDMTLSKESGTVYTVVSLVQETVCPTT